MEGVVTLWRSDQNDAKSFTQNHPAVKQKLKSGRSIVEGLPYHEIASASEGADVDLLTNFAPRKEIDRL